MSSALVLLSHPRYKRNPIIYYINNNLVNYQNLKLKDISSITKIPPSTIVRFFKQNNFKGFNHFKEKLIHDIALKSQIVEPNVDIKNLEHNYNHLKKFNSTEKINLIAKKINNAEKIIIGAIGSTNSIALNFYHKLIYFNINAYWSLDIVETTNTIINAPPNTIFFIFSYSGETPEIINWIKVANELSSKNISIISITTEFNNYVKNFSDYNLSINNDPVEYGLTHYRFYDMELLIFWIMKSILKINQDKFVSNFIKHSSIDENIGHK